MKRQIARIIPCIAIILVFVFTSDLKAQEGEKDRGQSFSIGLPLGLYNEDMHVGLEFAYPILDTLVIRLNATCLVDFYRRNELTWKGLENTRMARPVLYPSVSLIGRSPLFHNLRVYGGFTGGIAYVNRDTPVLPHVEGFGGVEFWAQKHHSFFVEFGGGAAITPRKIDFSRGVLISGGSRFYI
ncbi:MAG: hypothetical protein JW838_16100 [Spirochaetes bacterium]|nr:hypothetical protein [Spirochaetota bacterium]